MRAVASTPVAVDLGERHAVAADLVVAELLLLDVAQAGDDVVAERAGGVGRVSLDQRDVEPGIDPFRHARRGEAGKAAPDHHDPAAARPGPASAAIPTRRCRRQPRRRRIDGGSDAVVSWASTPFYFCAPYQVAMAWISSGVKPFTTRSMMVAARCPLRNSCSAATVLAGSRPIRRGGVESSVALGEWQPEQDSAPGGASAAIAARGQDAGAGQNARGEGEGDLHGRHVPECERRPAAAARAHHTMVRPWFLSGKVR